MQRKKIILRVFSLLLVVGLIASCEPGQEAPPQTQSGTPMSPAPVGETSLPRLADFQHEITLNEPLQSMTVGEVIRVPVTVKNTGSETWPTQPGGDSVLHVVHFSYRWFDTQGNVVVADGHRTPFPRDIKPSETVALEATIQAPDAVGHFVLRCTLVQEGVVWFADAGAQPLAVEVDVVAAGEQTTAVSEQEESATAAGVGQEDVSEVTAEPQPGEVVQASPAESIQESQLSSAQASQISSLLEQAQQQFQKKNFTTPKGDSTLDTCLAILKLVPGHPEALQLVRQMEQQYRDWAAASSNKKKQKTYVEKADSLASVVQTQR